MASEEREADQKQKQVRKKNPFMREMGKESGETRALGKAFAQELLDDDGAETDERDGERMAMENCDASERDTEKQKIDQHCGILHDCGVQGPAGIVIDPAREGLRPEVAAEPCSAIQDIRI
jgi:hypothetical protein